MPLNKGAFLVDIFVPQKYYESPSAATREASYPIAARASYRNVGAKRGLPVHRTPLD